MKKIAIYTHKIYFKQNKGSNLRILEKMRMKIQKYDLNKNTYLKLFSGNPMVQNEASNELFGKKIAPTLLELVAVRYLGLESSMVCRNGGRGVERKFIFGI